MSTVGFQRSTDGETITIFVDGERIGYVDHDGLGWDGMQSVENFVTEVAKKLGAEIIQMEEAEE
jgi:hypothetical protein